MTGQIVVVLNQLPNVKVIVGYSDIDYFNDPEHFGLVNEDGNFSDSICLNLKIFKFTSNTFSDSFEITDLNISASSNFERKQRYYSFTLEGEKLQQFLVQTSNTHQYIFQGFFAFVFQEKQFDFFVNAYYFEFFFTINKSFTTLINLGFKSLSQEDTINCNPLEDCQDLTYREVKFCADIKCAAFVYPDLHFNDNIILYQGLNSENSKEFYLTHPQVWYMGEGLIKQATVISVDNTQPGQIKIELKVEIVWSELTIQVISSLEKVITDGESSKIPIPNSVYGETDQISCIKAQGSESCPTCEEQYLAQGYAKDDCLSGSKISVVFINLLIIILLISY